MHAHTHMHAHIYIMYIHVLVCVYILSYQSFVAILDTYYRGKYRFWRVIRQCVRPLPEMIRRVQHNF